MHREKVSRRDRVGVEHMWATQGWRRYFYHAKHHKHWFVQMLVDGLNNMAPYATVGM